MDNKDIIIQPVRKRTIEEALATDYSFDIGDIISASFAATKGVKLKFFLAMLIYVVICIALGIVEYLIFGEEGNFLFTTLTNFLIYIVVAGFVVMAMNWLRAGQTEVSDLFSGFKIPLSIILATVLMTLLILIGFVLLIIPGIYLSICYLFVYYIILDNPNIKIWDALETSRKLIHKRWFNIFGLNLLFVLILMVSIIPFGIGLIWTFPAIIISNGLIYRKIFDIDEEVNVIEVVESNTEYNQNIKY